uniref:Pseudouridylate synthase RPUSD4, mitochondrial n=1 Tax=Xenopus tropicalis TaxID=8364 RepID=A0A6I8RRX8_XENTR
MAAAGGGATRGARMLAERIRAERKVLEGAARETSRKNAPTIVYLRELKSQVVREDPELVLVNKPHGLPVHGGPTVERSVASLLPALAKHHFGWKAEPLKLCHRLDRDTTGALILARTTEAAERVQQALREREVHRVYWALCLGTPSPREGILDIPIMEKETSGPQKHYKMALSPRFRVSEEGAVERVRVPRSAHEAVTRYRTLGAASGASLVELHPITGVKHQLRVHLALGLNCPILGDHKYSHWGRLAPQPPDSVLRALGLTVPQARTLSLHLHAVQLTLPSSDGSTPIVLQCPLPYTFRKTLRKLRIPPPDLESLQPPPTD